MKAKGSGLVITSQGDVIVTPLGIKPFTAPPSPTRHQATYFDKTGNPIVSDKIQMATLTADSLIITRPDDWHLHVRDGPALRSVVPQSAKHFKRAVIMPNLKPPVTTARQVLATAGYTRLTSLPPFQGK